MFEPLAGEDRVLVLGVLVPAEQPRAVNVDVNVKVNVTVNSNSNSTSNSQPRAVVHVRKVLGAELHAVVLLRQARVVPVQRQVCM